MTSPDAQATVGQLREDIELLRGQLADLVGSWPG